MNASEFAQSEIDRLKELQSNASEQYIKDDIQVAIEALERYVLRRKEKKK